MNIRSVLSNVEENGRMKGVLEEMGMLKSISLENYKCFKEKTDIEIAPLTVLCGVNSSGKSSILKSLLMLKQSYENESPYYEMTFNGDYVDNGFFSDIIYHKSKEDLKNVKSFIISNKFLLKDTSDETGYNPIKRQDISSFRELKRIYSKNIYGVNSFEIETTLEVSLKKQDNIVNNLEIISSKADNIVSFIENNYINFLSIEIKLKNKNGNYIESRSGNITLTKTSEKDSRIYNVRCSNIPNSLGDFDNYNFKCTCYFSNMHLSNIFQKNMNDNIKALRPVLLSICNIMALQFKGIDFIATLRHNPERNYLIKGNVNSVGITGEDMPVLLGKIHDKEIFTDLFCEATNNLPINDDGKIYISYLKLIQQWMDYLELGTIDLNGRNGFINLNISGHNIADVGFGVSQTLPIIVQGVYMSQDQTLLLEQPEIHLHPQMQLNMADFLITLAKHERNIILETHSDHIVNRIIKRVMEEPELIDEKNPIIRIIFLDKDDSSTPHKINIHIDKYKGVTNGTKNFFTQFGFETMDISSIGYENYKKDKRQ